LANGGWYGTPEQWRRIEAPLLELDESLRSFAQTYGLELTKNHRDWPERSLTWGIDVRCLIQVYLHSKDDLTLNLWICASQDRGRKRYWKETMLKEAVSSADMQTGFADALVMAKTLLDGWSKQPQQFDFANELRR
jgi:hypothetical protein